MYYIYEIKGVKVGCTDNFQRRQREQRSKGEMVLLETYTNIEDATRRERELQEVKGYSVDIKPYNVKVNQLGSKQARKKMSLAKKGKPPGNASSNRRVIVAIKDNIPVKVFNGLVEAVEITGIKNANIAGVLGGRQKTAGGYVWEYL